MTAATHAHEMRMIVEEAWRHHGALCWKQRLYQTSRTLRISPRRVQAILYGEVRRVWSDEIEWARLWYDGACDARRASGAIVDADFHARAAVLAAKL